ncbi:MAG: hypothetical protein ACRECX_08410 [Methyloceanibacter sp.]|uniref:hypothetical protein n=1 Tax=Methyloceanibacter sp. TaxID=1965321 RepID=UPI003D6CC56F
MIRQASLAVLLSLCLLAGGSLPAASAQDLVFVDVVGAPGDGDRALANALGERLLSQGLALSGTPAADAYEIQGLVRVSPAAGGKQNIRIDWKVFGPGGAELGVVTQEQAIRSGSLDNTWGRAAAAAAEAAAQDILKLLQRQ